MTRAQWIVHEMTFALFRVACVCILTWFAWWLLELPAWSVFVLAPYFWLSQQRDLDKRTSP